MLSLQICLLISGRGEGTDDKVHAANEDISAAAAANVALLVLRKVVVFF